MAAFKSASDSWTSYCEISRISCSLTLPNCCERTNLARFGVEVGQPGLREHLQRIVIQNVNRDRWKRLHPVLFETGLGLDRCEVRSLPRREPHGHSDFDCHGFAPFTISPASALCRFRCHRQTDICRVPYAAFELRDHLDAAHSRWRCLRLARPSSPS